jgi:hypothetical protein
VTESTNRQAAAFAEGDAEAAAYGLTPDDLSSWAPFTPVEIQWARTHGLGPATARRWALEGLRVCDTVRAVALGMAPEEARRWEAAHFAPCDAVEAAEQGISLETAIAWRDAGFILPDAALLIRDGWTLSDAVDARYAGIPASVRRPGGTRTGRLVLACDVRDRPLIRASTGSWFRLPCFVASGIYGI